MNKIARLSARQSFTHPELLRKLTPEDATGLKNIPSPPALVKDLIPQGAIVMVSGESHAGKTFLAMELARALAHGDKFLGYYEVPSIGNTLFIEQDAPKADTGAAFWKMLTKKWENYEDTGIDTPLNSLQFLWHPGLDLVKGEDGAAIIKVANEVSCFLGWNTEIQVVPHYDDDGQFIGTEELVASEVLNGVKLIVLDTFRAIHTGDENESGEMEAIMQDIKYIRAHTGATILLLHHDNASGERPRGSTAIEAACDTIFRITKNKRTNIVSCFTKKARIIQAESFKYRVDTKDDPEVGEIKEVVFVGTIDAEPETERRVDRFDFLNELLTHSGGMSVDSAQEWSGLNGVKANTFRQWVTRLVRDGQISREVVLGVTVGYHAIGEQNVTGVSETQAED